MYNILDKAEAIKSVQRYLRLSESGNYDSKTKSGVISFQEYWGITPSGIVDNVTFDLLRENYYRENAADDAARSDSLDNFPYKKDDYGNDLSIINSHISSTLENYSYYDRLPRGSYFDLYTERAIRRLREIFSIDGENTLDKELYARIKREIFRGD